VKIVYEKGTMKVYFDDLDAYCCAAKVELGKLGWIGFTAATGGLNQSHEIVSWCWSTFDSPRFTNYSTMRFDSIKVDPVIKYLRIPNFRKLKSILEMNNVKSFEMLSEIQKDIHLKGKEIELIKFYGTIFDFPHS
jgi:hypothetical protein